MKNVKIKMLVGALLLLSSVIVSAKEGGGHVGGGSTIQLDRETLTLFIKGDGLKKAMTNYLQTISVENISDVRVKSLFSQLMADNKLIADINTKDNYDVVPSERCQGMKNHPTYTKFGHVGGVICFDVNEILSELKQSGTAITDEVVLIKLASVAFHNHVHHFQEYNV